MKITKQNVRDVKDSPLSTLSTQADVEFGLKYIDHYYIDPNKVTSFAQTDIKKAVKKFQKTFGVPVSGVLDDMTIKAMKFTPRCGLPDYNIANATGPLASKWGLNKLTYYFESHVSGLSKTDQEDLTAMAFNHWTEVADLHFERVNSKNQARLILGAGQGRRNNMDGPGGVLAWAYLPQGNSYNGQLVMKFDLDETWTRDIRDRGILYLNVACHEYGHMLGLDHSSVQKALMAPYYNVAITKPQSNDDVPRIRRLYGEAKTPPVVPTPPTGNKHKVEILVDDLSSIIVDGKSIEDFILF